MTQDMLRALPSVDALLQDHTLREFSHRYSHNVVVQACRDALEAARKTILSGAGAPHPAHASVETFVVRFTKPSPRAGAG